MLFFYCLGWFKMFINFWKYVRIFFDMFVCFLCWLVFVLDFNWYKREEKCIIFNKD